MARWLVNGSLRSRGLVVALGIGLLIFGFVQHRDMPRDGLPEFTPPTVEVQTEALGLSANEVEQLITVPLEQDLLNGVAYLDTIKSESIAGLSKIEMIFEPGTPLSRARQVVNERLTQAFALPNVSSPPQMMQPMSSTSRVMMVRVSSKDKSLLELGLLARWSIRPQLMGIDGVSNVAIWGQREQQLQVHVDPARLQAEGVTLEEIIQTTGNALWVSPLTFLPSSTPGAGGFFDTATQRIGVEHAQPITSPEALENVVIESELAPAGAADAAPPAERKRLGDVVDVIEDHQPLIGDAVFADADGGLLVVIEKLPGANTVALTERLETALKNMEPGLEGVTVDSTLLRPADYVEDSMAGLSRSILVGGLLALLLLAALVFRLRTLFVTVASVAVALAGAVSVLSLRGETLNITTLAGLVLALGVLVDDAVTSAYETARSLDGVEDDRPSAFRRYAAGVIASRRPLAYATAILLVALAPLLVLSGEGGAFIPPIVLSYAGAVVVSLLVAMTLTPALTMLVRSGSPRAERRSPVASALQERHERLAARVGAAGIVPVFAVVAAVVVVGLVGLVFIDRGRSVVPTFKDHELLIRLEASEGTSLPEMKRIASRMGTELQGLRAVEHVGGHVGRAVLGDKTVNVSSSELWLRIDDAADYGSAKRKIEEIIHGYPGIEAEILTYGRSRIDTILGNEDGVEGKDLTVRMFGLTHEEISRQATKVQEVVAKVNGVKDATVRLPARQPTLEIEVDLPKAQALGIKPGDVRRDAATMISGLTVGNLFEDQKVFDVVVIGTPEARESLTKVSEMLIDPPGEHPPIRLDSVANVRVVNSPSVIRHEAVARSVDIGIDVGDRAVPEVATDIKKALLGVKHPVEYHAELLPGYEEQRSSSLRLLAVSTVVVIGIFLLLQAAAGSWRMASVLFLLLLAGLGGGAIGAALHGGDWTIGSIVGFFAVLGLTGRHVIAFVQRCHDLEDEGLVAESDVPSIVAAERFVPTIATALMTVVLMVPVLVFGSRAGHEIVSPIAAVVVGGVLASTLLSVVALPLLYDHYGDRSAESRERIELFTDPTAADEWQMAEF